MNPRKEPTTPVRVRCSTHATLKEIGRQHHRKTVDVIDAVVQGWYTLTLEQRMSLMGQPVPTTGGGTVTYTEPRNGKEEVHVEPADQGGL